MPTVSEYLADYQQGVVDLRAAVAGMTREQLLSRPVAGKWSTLEVVAHIADFEPILADRCKRILAMDNPTLTGADENAFALHLRYHHRDLEEELRVVEAVRASFARILATVTPEQLQRIGTHTERGVLTLERMLQIGINHVKHHLPFIHEKRKALGL